MEFEVHTKDYNVAEFYDAFVKTLPKIVMVNQGFYGEISADTFDRGQILRLHTVSQQSRVIAKTQLNGHDKFFSIPLSYKTNFCVVKHGKVGKEMSLNQIIREYSLPCKAQFPKHTSVEVGSHNVHTDTLPTLELTRVFNEVYLLGNFIIDGVLDQDVVHVPLYLSQLRLSLVTGIAGQTNFKWKSYQEELSRLTSNLEFNHEFGNPGIAEYMAGRLEKIVGENDLTYAKIEPAVYTNISTIFRAGRTPRGDLPIATNEYETFNSNESSRQVKTTTFRNALESTLTKTTPKPQIKPIPITPSYLPAGENVYEELNPDERYRYAQLANVKDTFKNSNLAKNNEKPQKTAPPTAPKPNTPKRSQSQRGGHTVQPPPPLPSREAKPSPYLNRKPQQKPPANHYENNVGQVSPVVRSIKKQEVVNTTVNPETSGKDKPEQVTQPMNTLSKESPVSLSVCPSDIVKLSVADVGIHLQSLKLDRYVQTFRDNMIDGKLLKELDRDLMRNEFQMNGLESLRLMKFIEEGHIPS